MIKFFRRIRRVLLSQNRLGKYFVYAIGEIVLVVIGILLALNINNKNEERKNEEKFVKIFKEIQDDLVADVNEVNTVFDRYVFQDSIQNLILNNKYTEEDYKLFKAVTLGSTYSELLLQTNGFENLNLNIDNIPRRFQPLLQDLKFLYGALQEQIVGYNARIRETVYKNVDYFLTLDWFQKRMKGTMTDEAIEFYLNSSYYKNVVVKYMNDNINLTSKSLEYKDRAIALYHNIDEVLENNKPTPEVLLTHPEDLSIYRNYSGKYKLKETNIKFVPDTTSIILNDSVLYYVDSFGKTKLKWQKPNTFYLEGGLYCIFKSTEGEEFVVSAGIGGYASFTKSDN